ncbi:MAG: UDP-glucose/GDP-mannose dehydrogenase family protein [Pseudomonadota bacterium]
MSVKITIIGTGYVGLVTGACFAELGHNVICVDNNIDKIEKLNRGIMPIYEPGLDQLIEKHSANGQISFTTDLTASVKGREAIFIAVGTPSNPEDGRADLKYVLAAAQQIAEAADNFAVVVTKSTVPVGTNRRVAAVLDEHTKDGVELAVASNPEFLREGAAIGDFMEPDRIVVGCEHPDAQDIVRRIYASLSSLGFRYMETDIESAEMIKYASNAFLAVKVSFINEVADLCEAVGANVAQVSEGMGTDNRIGRAFLRPGPGWGGSCFPKDTKALYNTAQDFGVETTIVEAAIGANDARKKNMADRVIEACGGSVEGKKIAVLGLTFKGQTDDMRDSPTLDILPQLTEAGGILVAFDPSNPHEAPLLLPDVALAESPLDATKDADVLVVATDWGIFNTYNLKDMAASMKNPVMVDLRNLFGREDVLKAGFEQYKGLGNV